MGGLGAHLGDAHHLGEAVVDNRVLVLLFRSPTGSGARTISATPSCIAIAG
jgi:hypothetical protein